MTPITKTQNKALHRQGILRKGVMRPCVTVGLFFAVWLSQYCTNDTRLMDLLNGVDICSKNQKLTPEQAAQAKVVGIGLSYTVIYPEVSISSGTK